MRERRYGAVALADDVLGLHCGRSHNMSGRQSWAGDTSAARGGYEIFPRLPNGKEFA